MWERKFDFVGGGGGGEVVQREAGFDVGGDERKGEGLERKRSEEGGKGGRRWDSLPFFSFIIIFEKKMWLNNFLVKIDKQLLSQSNLTRKFKEMIKVRLC